MFSASHDSGNAGDETQAHIFLRQLQITTIACVQLPFFQDVIPSAKGPT